MIVKICFEKLRDFRRKQDGSMSVEAVLALPLLLWAATATFTFFDAYKAQNATYRANYTISDMLSRETQAIDYAYLNGLFKVFRYMTSANATESWIRVSVVQCVAECDSEENRTLNMDWSRGANGAHNLDDTDFDFYNEFIPLLATSDRLILVETSMRYKPPFSNSLISFPERNLVSHVVTRPRFAPQLLWDDGGYSDGDGGAHDDLEDDGDV